jgi:Protein of unknown function (DUF3300)
MRQKSKLVVVSLLIAMFLMQDFGPVLSAQTAVPTPEELDQLLAPVALYPDSLLAQITTASTNPQEILDADSWLQQNSNLTGTALTDAAVKQGFDPAFVALVNFPQVLQMMADHVDDYAAIGQAFLADQGLVTASIQRLRSQAYASGALRDTPQQRVEVQQPAAGQTIYVIQPASPQVVYVPQYDPTVVYVRPASGAVVTTSLITFGLGIGIGALLVQNQPWGWGGWGWNWGSRRAYYNHRYWGGWANPYRPPHIWYRPRPVVYANRPGYRGNWGYRPPNYRPPNRPSGRPVPNRPGNRPGTRPPARPARPGAPGAPVAPRPTRPTNPNRPGQPTRPSNPNRPSNRENRTKPTTPNGPAAQPAPGNRRPPENSRPTRPASPSGPATQPPKEHDGTRRPSPDQTKPQGQTRSPHGGRPASETGASPQGRSQSSKTPSRQPSSQPRSQPPQQ